MSEPNPFEDGKPNSPQSHDERGPDDGQPMSMMSEQSLGRGSDVEMGSLDHFPAELKAASDLLGENSRSHIGFGTNRVAFGEGHGVVDGHVDMGQDEVGEFDHRKHHAHGLVTRAGTKDPIPDRLILLYLALGAVITGAISGILQFLFRVVGKYRTDFANMSNNVYGSYALFMIYSMTMIFAAVAITDKFWPPSAGSGIAQMKTWVSGEPNPNWLSMRALLVKMAGIFFTSAIVHVGAVGPFVQMAAMVTNNLSEYVPFFKPIKANKPLFKECIIIACCFGISVAFGVPIGGTFFAMEVTSTFYYVRNYWWTCVVNPIGGLVFLFVYNAPLHYTNLNDFFDVPLQMVYEPTPKSFYHVSEYLAFALLGIVVGILALIFNTTTSQVFFWRKKLARKYALFKSPYPYGMVVGFILVTLTCPMVMGPFVSYGNIDMVKNMFAMNLPRPSVLATHFPAAYKMIESLFYLALIKFCLMPFQILMPHACGAFMPLAVVGAVVGRVWGEFAPLHQVSRKVRKLRSGSDDKSLLIKIFGGYIYGVKTLPNGYALAGCAAFVSAATQTMGPVVIFMEMTRNLNYLFPMFVTAIAANFVVRHWITSLYNIFIGANQLKYFPPLRHYMRNFDTSPIVEVVKSELIYLPINATRDDAKFVLEKRPDDQVFAVVHSEESMRYVGCVSRHRVERLRDGHQHGEDLTLDPSLSSFEVSPHAKLTDVHLMMSITPIPLLPVVTNKQVLVAILRKEDIRQAAMAKNPQKWCMRRLPKLPPL